MNTGNHTTSDQGNDGGFRLEIEGGTGNYRLSPGETLLKGALRHGIRIPHLCMTGECGSCRCRLLRGKVRLKRDIGRHIDGAALKRGHLLACQSEPQSDVLLAVPGLSGAHGETPLLTTGGSIKSIEALNHDIRLLEIELDQPISYRAGQYAQLSVLGHPTLHAAPRCYSFCTAPAQQAQTTVQFHVRRVPGGQFTDWLFSANRTGWAIELTGPLGDFGYRNNHGKRGSHDNGRSMVCVAGGSGLAPIKAMLEDLCANTSAPDVTLFFAARSQRDLYCLADLARLQNTWPGPGRLLLLPVLSQEAEDSGWDGLRGYCADHLEHFCRLADSSFYLCGPPAMIDAILDKLGSSVLAEHIHYDRFLDRSHITDESS